MINPTRITCPECGHEHKITDIGFIECDCDAVLEAVIVRKPYKPQEKP